MDQRRFHRVTFSAPSDLMHHGMTYRGRLDNISLRGAMISADECIMISPGETCTLSVTPCPGAAPIVLTAEVVHCFFSMVGVKFVAFGEGAESRLHALMRDISGEPDKLRKELEVIQQHKAGQREG